MPKLGDFRRTKELELPNYPGSKLFIYDSVLMKDVINSDVDFDNIQEKDYARILHLFIKEWNFTDENDKLLPITPKNIEMLRMDAVMYLSNTIKKFAAEQKKN